MKSQSFDLQAKPENINKILNSRRRRDFLEEYRFFGRDGNKASCLQWILANMSFPGKNSVIEDLFKLAGLECITHTSISEFGLKILSGRYSYFTKLECLVYFLTVGDLLDRDLFVEAANVATLHTRNELVKFQANLNLAKYNNENVYILKEWLLQSLYPTPFYRVKNLLWLFPKDKGDLIVTVLLETLHSKKFSNEVIREISSGIDKSENIEVRGT